MRFLRSAHASRHACKISQDIQTRGSQYFARYFRPIIGHIWSIGLYPGTGLMTSGYTCVPIVVTVFILMFYVECVQAVGYSTQLLSADSVS